MEETHRLTNSFANARGLLQEQLSSAQARATRKIAQLSRAARHVPLEWPLTAPPPYTAAPLRPSRHSLQHLYPSRNSSAMLKKWSCATRQAQLKEMAGKYERRESRQEDIAQIEAMRKLLKEKVRHAWVWLWLRR